MVPYATFKKIYICCCKNLERTFNNYIVKNLGYD